MTAEMVGSSWVRSNALATRARATGARAAAIVVVLAVAQAGCGPQPAPADGNGQPLRATSEAALRDLERAVRDTAQSQKELTAELREVTDALRSVEARLRAAQSAIAVPKDEGGRNSAASNDSAWTKALRDAESRRVVEQVAELRDSLLTAIQSGEALANAVDADGNPSGMAPVHRKFVAEWKEALEALSSIRSLDDLVRFRRERNLPSLRR